MGGVSKYQLKNPSFVHPSQTTCSLNYCLFFRQSSVFSSLIPWKITSKKSLFFKGEKNYLYLKIISFNFENTGCLYLMSSFCTSTFFGVTFPTFLTFKVFDLVCVDFWQFMPFLPIFWNLIIAILKIFKVRFVVFNYTWIFKYRHSIYFQSRNYDF